MTFQVMITHKAVDEKKRIKKYLLGGAEPDILD